MSASSTKLLSEVAQELGVANNVLIDAINKSDILHRERLEKLETSPELVFLSQAEIDRLAPVIFEQKKKQGMESKARSSSRPAYQSTSTTSGVRVNTRRVRRVAPAPEPKPVPPPSQAEAAVSPPEAAATPEPTLPPASKPEPTPPKPEPKPEAEARVSSSPPPAEPRIEEKSPSPQKKLTRNKKLRDVDSAPAEGDKFGRKRKVGKQTLTVSDEAKIALKLKRRKKQRLDHMPKVHGFQKPAGRVVRDVELPETISLQVLAQRMAVKVTDIVSELFKAGMSVTINSVLDQETAAFIVHEFGHNPILEKEQDFRPELGNPDEMVTEPRPPVVTVMGHVDHGKTSLLDYIRKTKVVDGEAGGITQHMGAYRVEVAKGKILFIDTPGHELFTEMRARGAKVTDIIVLVVAADDGVMPQTEEAISHAKAAGVPLVVAINKIDKHDANPDKVIEQLVARGVAPEKWGGDSIIAKVSAATGEGIEELLESILLQAEVLELKAPVNVPAHGVAIEAHTDKGKGHLVTMIAKGGELKEGEIIVCDTEFGRVRTLFDEDGKKLEVATASVPFVVQGLSGLPSVGSDFYVVDTEKRAREIVQVKRNKARDQKMAASAPSAFADLAAIMQSGGSVSKQVLNVIVKADVYGTLEAITRALRKESNDEAEIRVVHSGIGGITTSDVNLAHASMARIVAFNVRPDNKARKLIESRGVPVGYYSVIYEATDDLRRALSDMLTPLSEEKFFGSCTVLEVFRISKVGRIAGCRVEDGVITSSCRLRVIREGTNIYEGEIATLKHFKEEVKEVKSGLECGIQMKRFQDFKQGDVLEAFEVIESRREFEAAPVATDEPAAQQQQ